MRLWARQNRRDIKYATKIFKAEIDAIPEEDALQIHEMAYREAKEFLTAFRAKGSASRLAGLWEFRLRIISGSARGRRLHSPKIA